VFVTPSAKRVAREHGIDAKALRGTGPGGRVVEADVLKHIRAQEVAAKAPVAVAAPTNGGQVEPRIVAAPVAVASVAASTDEYDLQPLTKIRRIIAEKLSQSYREAVHVTLDCEVDMAEATRLRSQLALEWSASHGVKVTYTDLIVRAVAKALTEHRALNATFTPEGIRLYKRVNVGVAMAIPAGLVVPVVRDADALPLLEIVRTVRKLTEKARAGQIGPDEMRGGTFTISNMGTLGIDHFTPIINGGEGAILGVGQIAEKPVVREGQIVARPIMSLSLTFDHRLVDGAPAARFLQRVKQYIEKPYLWLVN
jgi:pyruvate dehydrogenase E2 component (dihydrolipoamide acetyltransferase)